MDAIIVTHSDVDEAICKGKQVVARHALGGIDVAVADVIGELEIGKPAEHLTEVLKLPAVVRGILQRNV